MLEDYDALIFDLDGTLVDSLPLHHAARLQASAEWQLPISPAQWLANIEIPTREFLQQVAGQASLTLDITAFTRRKVAIYEERIAEIHPFATMLTLLKTHHGQRKLAIGTGSPRRQVEAILQHTGLAAYFDVVVCGDEVARPKPAPDIFLRVLELLALPAGRCLVIEDTEAGVQAAEAAGLKALLAVQGTVQAR